MTTEEWIELFNENDFEVNLSDWQIRDTTGVTKTYQIPKGTKVGSKSFLLLPRAETKITLQNNGDGLELLNPDNEVVHKVNYEKTPQGQSFNRTLADWLWSSTLTPGKENIITELTEAQSLEVETDENKKSSDLKDISQARLPDGQAMPAGRQAKIDETLPATSNTLIIFLVALSLALFSVIIVLFIKKKIETKE